MIYALSPRPLPKAPRPPTLGSRSDELFTRQFAVAILIEVFEAGFEVVFAFESGLVFFEAESVILVGVPAGEGSGADFGCHFGGGSSGLFPF